jgi:cysteine desulfurase / selenocysteine lyase
MSETIYLNTATTGYPKSHVVLDTVNKALTTPPSDVRHSKNPTIHQFRKGVAQHLNFVPDETFFLSDATLALNYVIKSVVGTEGYCLTDNRAHNAITRTLHAVAPGRWRAVRLYTINEETNLTALTQLLRRDTKLVCLTHTSNVFGSVYDVRPIIAKIRHLAPDCMVMIDASQSYGSTEVHGLSDADFVVLTGHKHLHSLPGAAVLMAKKRLESFVHGGTGTYSARLAMTEYSENVVEVGTPNLPAIQALDAALEDYASNGHKYREHINDLVSYLWTELKKIDGVTVLGRAPGHNRNGTVACVVPGYPEQEWVPMLASEGIAVRGGLHCCPLAHEDLPNVRAGTLRISISRFNCQSDLEALLYTMKAFCKIASV